MKSQKRSFHSLDNNSLYITKNESHYRLRKGNIFTESKPSEQTIDKHLFSVSNWEILRSEERRVGKECW